MLGTQLASWVKATSKAAAWCCCLVEMVKETSRSQAFADLAPNPYRARATLQRTDRALAASR